MLHPKKIAVAIAAALVAAGPAVADQLTELKAQVEELQKKVKELDSNVGSATKNFKLVTAGDEDGTFKLPGSETSVGFYGFIHVDGFKDFKGRSGDWAMDGGSIAIEKDPSGINADTRTGKFNFTAETSRLGMKTATPTELGTLRTKLEFDFYKFGVLKSGYTNSYNPRLRHAYGELTGDWGTLLVGQTWSTFMNLDAIPETVDFNGHGSAVLARQPMVRYGMDLGKAGNLAVALEDSASLFNGRDPQSNPNIDKRPDLIANWTLSGERGMVSVQALNTEFRFDDNAGTSAKKSGYGFGVGGTLKLGDKDTLLAQYYGGKGISRYVPAANYNSEIFDTTSRQIELTKVKAITAGWAHAWTDAVRTNLSYGQTKMDDIPAAALPANEKITMAFANVFYGVAKNTELGLEYANAKRELTDGLSGKYSRVQASMHYSF